MRPENTARLTVSHRPIMFTYNDLREERHSFIRPIDISCLDHNFNSMMILYCRQKHSHLGMDYGFAGDIALHLGLVDGVDGCPHHTATNHNGPESVTLQRIWIKAGVKGELLLK